jgi:alpha-tubulin suppressor-like RCC1 family protein
MVAAGSNNSHAIRLDGTLWTWGDGANGALGDSTNTSKSSPVQIGASSWKWVTGSEIGGFAIDINGRLFAWGTGVNGIIGDGTSTGKNSPVQIGTSSWTMVHAAKNNTLAIALRIDGLLFAWGNNTSGNLGVNSATVTFSSPVAIGASSWTMCAIMNQGGLAIRVDGTLWSWGSLPGDNTITGKSSPVQIGASTWSKVYAGGPIKWAIRSDNTLWNWGSGSGTGVPTPSTSSPVQVGTSAWIGVDSAFNAAVSAINLFSAGIKQ